MLATSAVRKQIEDALAHRVPGALSPRQRGVVPHIATGVPEVDALLGGGLPTGAITEVVGSSCSGQTSFALALIAQLTGAGQAAAWIDVADELDPESAAAAGVDLTQQLWIRCGGNGKHGEKHLAQPSVVRGLLSGEVHRNAYAGGGGSPHPRNEVRGMPEAIQALLQQPDKSGKSGTAPSCALHPIAKEENPAEARRRRKSIGTPGMPNRPLQPEADCAVARRLFDRTEQASTDRQPPRRGEHFNLQSSKNTLRESTAGYGTKIHLKRGGCPLGVWARLDQAIRAADLLLSAGGFAALVIDLGSTPAEFASRIPMATWFRFRAAAERSRTTVLLLTQHPCAGSSAGVVLRLNASSVTTAGRLITGRSYKVSISRQRFAAVDAQQDEQANVVAMRKPPQSERCASWSRHTAWVAFAERAHEKNVLAWAGSR